MLDALGITEHEFVYLMQSFNASELYYQIAESKTITLSQYRKTLLSNPKRAPALFRRAQKAFAPSGRQPAGVF